MANPTISADEAPARPDRAVIAACAVAVIAAVAAGVASSAGLSDEFVILPLFIAGGLGLAWLAIRDFTLFVALILVLRSSLDALKASAGATSLLDPAALLSVAFLIGGGVWLLVQPAEQRVERSPLVVPLGLLALVGAISTITSPNPASGLVDTVKLATVVLMIAVLNQVCRTERDAKVVLVAAIASTLAPLAVALYQGALETGLHYSDGFGRATGTFNHPNPFAIYLCFSILMLVGLFRFVHGRTRLAVVGLTVGCTIALYFTYTRSAWISTVVGLLAIAAFSGKKIVGILAVGIVVAGLAIPSVASRFADLDETVTQSGAAGNSLVWRFEYWGQALTLSDDPLLGSGLSAVRVEGSEEKSPHNDFIRVFVETGILGLIAYLWFLLRGALVVAAGRRGTDRASLWYGVVLGFGGVFAAYVLLSVVSNVITQLVLLWYLAAYASLAIAAPRLAPRPADERALVDA